MTDTDPSQKVFDTHLLSAFCNIVSEHLLLLLMHFLLTRLLLMCKC